ncbi:MAG: hypothetical protein AAGC81_10320 [Pseudomonadota bacterium]
MATDGLTLAQFLRMAGYVSLGFLSVSLELAPVGLTAGALPSPDLLFCLTAFFALRRPEAVPLVLIFIMGFGRDLLTDAPPGAGVLALVLTALLLAECRGWFLQRPFFLEWIGVTLIFAAGLLLQWLLVAATFAPTPQIGSLGWLVLITAGGYACVALVLRVVLRIDYAPELRRLGGAS